MSCHARTKARLFTDAGFSVSGYFFSNGSKIPFHHIEGVEMHIYEQLQQSIDKTFTGYERDGAHLVLLPSIIYNKMITQLGIPGERLRMSAGRDISAGESIPPQPERGEISFDIIVTFPVKNNEPLKVTVPISATYDRYQYQIKCDGNKFDVLNNPEVDQESLADVVKQIAAVLNVKVKSILTN